MSHGCIKQSLQEWLKFLSGDNLPHVISKWLCVCSVYEWHRNDFNFVRKPKHDPTVPFIQDQTIDYRHKYILSNISSCRLYCSVKELALFISISIVAPTFTSRQSSRWSLIMQIICKYILKQPLGGQRGIWAVRKDGFREI